MAILHPKSRAVLFSDEEILSKGNGEIRLATGFAEHLLSFRLALNEPMHVTSFCRDPDHNRREGGHISSAHLTHNPRWLDDRGEPHGAFGLDVAFWSSAHLARLVSTAWMLEWSAGINFSKNFVHLDKRRSYTTKTELVIFGY